MVNKGRIHREIRKFLIFSLKLIKTGDKLMVEIRGKWYIMKDNFKSIPRNQESSKLILISRRN